MTILTCEPLWARAVVAGRRRDVMRVVLGAFGAGCVVEAGTRLAFVDVYLAVGASEAREARTVVLLRGKKTVCAKYR